MKINKSKVAREFWRKIFKENLIDLRNSDARKAVVKEFIESNQGWKASTDLRFFRLAFDRISREFGTSTSKFGVKPEPSRVKKNVGNMNISAKSDEKKVHPLFQKQDEKKPEPTVKGIPNAQQLNQQDQQMAVNYSAQSIAAIFDTMFNIFCSRYPTCSKLSEGEKQSLGDAWLPIFNEYFQTGSKWILPAIVTIPIVLVRFTQYAKAKKEKELHEKYDVPESTPEKKSNWSDMNFGKNETNKK